MKEKFLPIGTVVLLKNGKKKVMINSYLIITNSNDSKIFEYGGCLYPEGVLDSKLSIGFNHSDIETIVFNGFENEEYKQVNELLLKNENDIRNKLLQEKKTNE
ncbi:MAG: DUF4176 domain-containing protein [Bacilli bacterium]|nr:DUF4176 domain-containing protein [Bacilli bacterium]